MGGESSESEEKRGISVLTVLLARSLLMSLDGFKGFDVAT